MPADVAPALIAVLVIAVVVPALIRASVRLVRPDERLVIVNMGRIDHSGARGPGLVLVTPVVGRGVRVSLAPQHLEMDAVPVLTDDGRSFGVDLDLRFRVTDPVTFVSHVPDPVPAGVRIIVRGLLAHAVASIPTGEAPDRGALVGPAVRLIQDQLTLSGARDVAVRVTRVRPIALDEGDEQARLIRLGARWLRPDPDKAGSQSLSGDIRLAATRIWRLLPWEGATIVACTIGLQLAATPGLPAWSPETVLLGVVAGIVLTPVVALRFDLNVVLRNAGRRRTVVWIVVLAAWTLMSLAVAFGLALAAGLYRVRS